MVAPAGPGLEAIQPGQLEVHYLADRGALNQAVAAVSAAVEARLSELAQAERAVRLAAERALSESEGLYRAIGESIDYGVWVCDAEGRNVYNSPSFYQYSTKRFTGWASADNPITSPVAVS